MKVLVFLAGIVVFLGIIVDISSPVVSIFNEFEVASINIKLLMVSPPELVKTAAYIEAP